MIEIKIPKEITEYKERFLFGLTVRQCVSVAAALGICIPLYIFGKDYFGSEITSWLVILIAVPVFGFGFIKYNGMTFEKLVSVLFRQKFAEPQKRKYEELPVFYRWREEIISNAILRGNAAAKRRSKQRASEKEKSAVKTVAAKTHNSPSNDSREMEFSVLGGSLNVKWSKRKGVNVERKDKKQKQRKGNG